MAVTITDNEGPLAPSKLEAVEKQLGVRFPGDYKTYMLQYNGGRTEPDGFSITWSEDQEAGEDWKTSVLSWLFFVLDDPDEDENLLTMNCETFSGRIPPDTIAIGCDAGGNLLLLALEGPYKGMVLFWVKDCEASDGARPGYENIGVVADSFEDFLAKSLR